jgi:hypothetical protein
LSPSFRYRLKPVPYALHQVLLSHSRLTSLSLGPSVNVVNSLSWSRIRQAVPLLVRTGEARRSHAKEYCCPTGI